MKNQKKTTLKGTVLFTTVSVMALLIIFLMTTLMLANASNSRVHKTYSSSQASYTARAAVDSFITAMQRTPAVAVAVEEMDAAHPLYPEVQIGDDASLGSIGCYDLDGNYHPNCIAVEPTGETSYSFYNKHEDSSSVADWYPTEVIKISATVRVGSEEETVSAFINKAPHEATPITPTAPQVKGLQVIGGTLFPTGERLTGGLGVNLAENSNEEDIGFRNKSIVETTLSFLNGNALIKTTSFEVNVKAPANLEESDLPFSQTVITGNVAFSNNKFITVDYDPNLASDWTAREIPYLYVNGFMFNKSELTLVDSPKNAPYNIFAGTVCFDENEVDIGSADIYMMDEVTGESKNINITDPYSGGSFTKNNVQVGKNIFGHGGTSKLSAWVESVANKSDMTYQTHGGNIYCNGDLTIAHAEIAGDVRVRGNLTLDHATISGNVIVGGTFSATDSTYSKLYTADAAGGLSTEKYPSQKMDNNPAESDYRYNTDIDLTTFEGGEKFKIHYFKWDPAAHPTDDGRLVDPFGDDVESGEILYYDWLDDFDYYNSKDSIEKNFLADFENIYREKSYDYIMAEDAETSNFQIYRNFIKTEPVADLTNDIDGSTDYYYAAPMYLDGELVPTTGKKAESQHYYVDNETNGSKFVLSQSELDEALSNPEGTTNYYVTDLDGNSLSETTDSPYTYWYGDDYSLWVTDENDVPYKPDPAAESGDALNITSIGLTKETIYPQDKTREAIYGVERTVVEETGDGDVIREVEFVVDPDTKIITNIGEARTSLGLDPKTGEIIGSQYPDDDKLGDYISSAKAVKSVIGGNIGEWGGDGSEVEVGEITGDCYIKGAIKGKNGESIKIYPKDSTTTVVFDNCWISSDVEFVRSGGANLRVIFVGENTLNGKVFKPSDVDYSDIKYTDNWNITYYGTEGSIIKTRNDGTFFGSFKCPKSKFIMNTQNKPTVTYTDENGVTMDVKPTIVGNAMFAEVESQNTFSLIYTQSGSDAGEDSTPTSFKTATGYYDIAYYSGS